MSIDRHIIQLLERTCETPRERAKRWRRLAAMLSHDDGHTDPALIRRALDVLSEDRDAVSPATRKLVARTLSQRRLPDELGDLITSEVEALLLRTASHERVEGHRQLSGYAAATNPESSPAPRRAIFTQRIDYETNAAGVIRWLEGAPPAALIGRQLIGTGKEAVVRPERSDSSAGPKAFRNRPCALGPNFLGKADWRVSGHPVFDQEGGRFLGYRGTIANASETSDGKVDGNTPPVREAPPQGPDLLRELAHEVKTPLNAIIGFAEIIDGQFLGPAHRPYRRRAAGIAVQARRLLSAVADLDLAARLESEGSLVGEGSEFKTLFPKVAAQIHEKGKDRGVEFLYKLEAHFAKCALDPRLSERLVMRLAGSVIGVAGEGEALLCTVSSEGRFCRISISRPAALRDIPSERLLDPAFDIEGQGRLGIGFSLRLLRGLAGLAKGELRVLPTAIELLIPGKRD